MNIPEIIKTQRKALKITQAQLAQKINCRQATISEFENQKHEMGSALLSKALQALNLKIKEGP